MARLPEDVKKAVSLLKEAGFRPDVDTVGSHIKIRAPGLPLIICAKTASDPRGGLNTTARVKRFIRAATPQTI